MRRFVFVVMMFVFLFLFGFFIFSNKEIYSFEDFNKLELNQKVSLKGFVVNEEFVSNGLELLILDSGIKVVCDCGFENFFEQEVFIEGVVSEFNGEKQVEVLEIWS